MGNVLEVDRQRRSTGWILGEGNIPLQAYSAFTYAILALDKHQFFSRRSWSTALVSCDCMGVTGGTKFRSGARVDRP